MSYLNTVEEGIREKVEDTSDSVLGASGTFDIRTSATGVSAAAGFDPIDTGSQDALFPLLIINEDDTSEWEVGLYASTGTNGVLERGSATDSHVLASPSTGWTSFSAGKKSYSVVDISNRFQMHEIIPDPGGASFNATPSVIRYDTNSFPQFNGPHPLVDMTGVAAGQGIYHNGSTGLAIFERVLRRDTTSNATPKVIASVRAGGNSQQITLVHGRVLISNQVNTPIAKAQEFSLLVRYNSLSTATIVGTETVTTLHEDASLSSATISLGLVGTTIQVTANGLASPSLQWTLELNITAGDQ